MQCGKYRVIKEIHVFNCTFGQLKMGLGVIFEVVENGWTGRVGDFLFPAKLLDGCEQNIVRIGW